MGHVQNVELSIQYPVTGSGTAHVTVRAGLYFSPEENGSDFRLRIRLYGSDIGEGTPIFGDPKPIYVFRFGLHDFDVVHASRGAHVYEVRRDIPMASLDEDPGSITRPVETPPGTPPIVLVIPNGDEIYAVVSLTSEMESNIVEMKYIGIVHQ